MKAVVNFSALSVILVCLFSCSGASAHTTIDVVYGKKAIGTSFQQATGIKEAELSSVTYKSFSASSSGKVTKLVTAHVFDALVSVPVIMISAIVTNGASLPDPGYPDNTKLATEVGLVTAPYVWRFNFATNIGSASCIFQEYSTQNDIDSLFLRDADRVRADAKSKNIVVLYSDEEPGFPYRVIPRRLGELSNCRVEATKASIPILENLVSVEL